MKMSNWDWEKDYDEVKKKAGKYWKPDKGEAIEGTVESITTKVNTFGNLQIEIALKLEEGKIKILPSHASLLDIFKEKAIVEGNRTRVELSDVTVEKGKVHYIYEVTK